MRDTQHMAHYTYYIVSYFFKIFIAIIIASRYNYYFWSFIYRTAECWSCFIVASEDCRSLAYPLSTYVLISLMHIPLMILILMIADLRPCLTASLCLPFRGTVA